VLVYVVLGVMVGALVLSSFVVEVVDLVATMELVVELLLVVLEGSGSGSGSSLVIVLVIIAPVVDVAELVDEVEFVEDKPIVVLESKETSSAHLRLSLVHHCIPSTSNCWLPPPWQSHKPKAFSLPNQSKHCPPTSIDLRSLPKIPNLAQASAAPTSSKRPPPADLKHPVPPASRSITIRGLVVVVVVVVPLYVVVVVVNVKLLFFQHVEVLTFMHIASLEIPYTFSQECCIFAT
jgi:hypothetical protein